MTNFKYFVRDKQCYRSTAISDAASALKTPAHKADYENGELLNVTNCFGTGSYYYQTILYKLKSIEPSNFCYLLKSLLGIG
jgi:hypothetical protein